MGCYKRGFTAVTPGVTPLGMTHPLAQARKAAGLSQEALAVLIGKDRITVLRIEKHQQRPSLQTIEKIIDALKVKNVAISADDFISAANNGPAPAEGRAA